MSTPLHPTRLVSIMSPGMKPSGSSPSSFGTSTVSVMPRALRETNLKPPSHETSTVVVGLSAMPVSSCYSGIPSSIHRTISPISSSLRKGPPIGILGIVPRPRLSAWIR